MDIARRGDMAIMGPWAIPARKKLGRKSPKQCSNEFHRKAVYEVLTDPELPRDILQWEPGIQISEVRCPVGCQRWTYTSNLIPIRNPDADQSRTSEKEREHV